MGKTDKLLAKFLNSKKTFEWDELVVLFSSLGYVKKEMQECGFSMLKSITPY